VITDRLPSPVTRWSPRIGLSIVVGAAAGLAAAGLDWAIHSGSEAVIGLGNNR
jgi:hypothetical protein